MKLQFKQPTKAERAAGVVMLLAVFLAFYPVIGFDFIDFDDGEYILHNQHVRTGLSLENCLWAFRSLEASNWHPLTWLSHMLDCEIYGLNAGGHHLTSLFLHIANTLLLFLVLRSATGDSAKSALVSLVFGLHPIHIESVAWISERKNVLSGFFWMLGMLAYLDYVRRRKAAAYVRLVVCFALGLMAKPMLVTLPFVLLLLDFWPLKRWDANGMLSYPQPALGSAGSRSLARLCYEKAPLFALSALSSAVTLIAQSQGSVVLSLQTVSLTDRLLNGCISYTSYLFKLFWPSKLAVFYPHPGQGVSVFQGIAAGALLVLLTVLVIGFIRRRPFLSFGWLWYIGTLVPVIGIIQVGIQGMADRYAYLPSIGAFILIVWAIPGSAFRGNRGRTVLAGGCLLVFLSLFAATRVQLGYWRDTESIFRRALEVTHNNYVAYYNLGNALLAKCENKNAADAYEKALSLWPQYPDAHNNLGFLHASEGRMETAMAHYRKAIQSDPEHFLARLNLADALKQSGYLSRAIAQYQALAMVYPDSAKVHNALGVALAEAGSGDRAEIHLTRAVELCPDCAEPLNNLGRTLTIAGRYREAMSYLKQAITVKTDYAEAYNNLGLLFWEIGNADGAEAAFASALRINPAYQKARLNLKRLIETNSSLSDQHSQPTEIIAWSIVIRGEFL